MELSQLIQQLDQEISKLQQAKRILEGQETGVRTKSSGRRGPRKMSAEARKRISEAQKARWAKVKTKGKYHLGIAFPLGMEAEEKRDRQRWAKLGLDKPKNRKRKKAA